jgi:hypothetical protein
VRVRRARANFSKMHAHVRVRVRLEFWQNAHVREMCVRPKNECANVRACEAKNRRNSQIALNCMTFNKCVLQTSSRVVSSTSYDII